MKIAAAAIAMLTALWAVAAERQWPTWEGWELMGAPGVFSYVSSARGRDLVASASDVTAALRMDAEIPLTADLQLSWQWQVDQIPSKSAEDTEASHHYFAVSVIFDNGKNLSYIWSAKLNKEYAFQCPLKDWRDRETHVVVETGPARFGRLLSYRRDIMADYRRFIGGDVPAKVSKVWIVVLAKGGDQPVKARLASLALISKARGRIDYL